MENVSSIISREMRGKFLGVQEGEDISIPRVTGGIVKEMFIK